jgi:hypothetical protein
MLPKAEQACFVIADITGYTTFVDRYCAKFAADFTEAIEILRMKLGRAHRGA